MAEIGPRGLEIAPVRRRAAAACIDMTLLGVPIVAVSAGVALLYHRRRGDDLEPARFAIPPHWDVAVRGGTAAAGIAMRNWRSPGCKLLGLRRVDRHTGGPVSVRSALVQSAVTLVLHQVNRELLRPWRLGSQRRLAAVQAEVDEFRRAHPDDTDDDALQKAMQEIRKRHKLSAGRSCGPPVLAGAAIQATMLASPLNQSPTERLAGVLVIVED
jgi:RDD family